MSESSTAKPTPTSKKRKQPAALEGTPQRARKRAHDREAQRTFREKTKTYIAHLVQTVESCKADSGSPVVQQLLDQNTELYQTVEQLRKILTDIYTSTEPEIPSPNGVTQTFARETALSSPRAVPSPEGRTVIAASTSIGHPQATLTALPLPLIEEGREDEVGVLVPVEAREPEQSSEQIELIVSDFLGRDAEISNRSVTEHAPDVLTCSDDGLAQWQRSSTGTPHDSELRDRDRYHSAMRGLDTGHLPWLLVDMQTPMRCGINQGVETFDLWSVTNRVYNKIFGIAPSRASAAISFDSGAIFKAINNGWDSLRVCDQENPVGQILREYDNLICDHLDQVNRVAIACKNQLLIEVRRSNMDVWPRIACLHSVVLLKP